MGKEIERKFLLAVGVSIPIPAKFRKFGIKQGYIHGDMDKNIRIRLTRKAAVLGIKFTQGPLRDEFEYEIPEKDGQAIYDKAIWKLEKLRLAFKSKKIHYDIDTYPNGMVVIEAEFTSEEQMNAWVKPSWIGEEVTNDSKYSNVVLAQQNLRFKGWE
jgi:adenylate cyclase